MCNYVSISINYNVNFHIQKRSHVLDNCKTKNIKFVRLRNLVIIL